MLSIVEVLGSHSRKKLIERGKKINNNSYIYAYNWNNFLIHLLKNVNTLPPIMGPVCLIFWQQKITKKLFQRTFCKWLPGNTIKKNCQNREIVGDSFPYFQLYKKILAQQALEKQVLKWLYRGQEFWSRMQLTPWM